MQKRPIILRSLLIVATPYLSVNDRTQDSKNFFKYRLFYRALLQKRSIILRSLLIVATLHLSVNDRTRDNKNFFFSVCCGIFHNRKIAGHVLPSVTVTDDVASHETYYFKMAKRDDKS